MIVSLSYPPGAQLVEGRDYVSHLSVSPPPPTVPGTYLNFEKYLYSVVAGERGKEKNTEARGLEERWGWAAEFLANVGGLKVMRGNQRGALP